MKTTTPAPAEHDATCGTFRPDGTNDCDRCHADWDRLEAALAYDSMTPAERAEHDAISERAAAAGLPVDRYVAIFGE